MLKKKHVPLTFFLWNLTEYEVDCKEHLIEIYETFSHIKHHIHDMALYTNLNLELFLPNNLHFISM